MLRGVTIVVVENYEPDVDQCLADASSSLSRSAHFQFLLFLNRRPVPSDGHHRRDRRCQDRGRPSRRTSMVEFLEHGGDIVNAGIWSEMLVDRKFLLPGSDCRTHASARDG